MTRVSSFTVDVTEEAVGLIPALDEGQVDSSAGGSLKVRVVATGDNVTVGGVDVEAGVGWTLTAADPEPFELASGDLTDQLYAVCAEGESATVEVFRSW